MTLKHPGGELFKVEYPPKNWHFIDFWGDGHAFVNKNGLRLLIDCELKRDNKKWVHLSVSRAKWNPSHDDMCLVKDDFIGNRYAYSIYPPKEEYVNINQYCLHIWALAETEDGRVLPEFSGEVYGIGKTI